MLGPRLPSCHLGGFAQYVPAIFPYCLSWMLSKGIQTNSSLVCTSVTQGDDYKCRFPGPISYRAQMGKLSGLRRHFCLRQAPWARGWQKPPGLRLSRTHTDTFPLTFSRTAPPLHCLITHLESTPLPWIVPPLTFHSPV